MLYVWNRGGGGGSKIFLSKRPASPPGAGGGGIFRGTSFLMSDNGVYTIAALYYHHLSDAEDAIEKRDQFVTLVLDSLDRCYDELEAQDEILYGNSGYLYCLILLHDILSDDNDLKKKIIETMDKVATDVYSVGKKRGK